MTDKVYDQREDLYAAEQGSAVHFINQFTGKPEPFLSASHANDRTLQEAANRIAELQEEIREIKAFLVL